LSSPLTSHLPGRGLRRQTEYFGNFQDEIEWHSRGDVLDSSLQWRETRLAASLLEKKSVELIRTPIARAILLAGVCLLAISPFFWWGSPSGHDFEFHMFSWMEVLGQWKQGIVYPRWAGLAHFGYGEARFLFYPPASWTLGSALGAVLPWGIVPGSYCWFAIMLAGVAMYRLAREWLQPADALFAAVFYAVNPYHLLIIYWRSAYAELLASALLPLLLLFLLRIQEPGYGETERSTFRPTLQLSLVLAAAWLTNAPAAVMIHYSTAGLALLFVAHEIFRKATPERSLSSRVIRPLARTGIAILLGAGLASFYLLPAIYEQRWVEISQVMAPGVRPQDNFLFTKTADPDHNRFNLLVSSLALAEIVVFGLAVRFSRRSATDRKEDAAGQNPCLLFSVWGVATTLLLFSVSNQLWQHLPKFRFVQLPFRWLLCLNTALAILLTLAAKRWTSRLLVYGLLLGVLIVAGYRIQAPWWDTSDDIQDMSDTVRSGTGYEGTDEYVPAGADAYELNKNLPIVSDDDGVAVPTKMLSWGPTEKHLVVNTAEPQDLTIRLFSYPAWGVVVNGKSVETEKTDDTKLMVIPVGAGESDVHIYFRQTTDRLLGKAVTLMSLVVLVTLWMNPSWVARLLRTTRLAGTKSCDREDDEAHDRTKAACDEIPARNTGVL
jgi:hypothetical protein